MERSTIEAGLGNQSLVGWECRIWRSKDLIDWKSMGAPFTLKDGIWWIIWGATRIAPLKPNFSGLSEKAITIAPSGPSSQMGHEGSLIMKIEGKYVLFGTGGSTGQMRKGSYNLYYATADQLSGP